MSMNSVGFYVCRAFAFLIGIAKKPVLLSVFRRNKRCGEVFRRRPVWGRVISLTSIFRACEHSLIGKAVRTAVAHSRVCRW